MPEFSGEVTHVEVAGVPLWLIALLPFIGSVINALFGRRFQKSGFQAELQKKLHIGSVAVSAVAIGAMLLAFILALINFAQLIGLESGHRYLYTHGWQMLRIGSLDVNFSFAMDPLSGIMTLIITGVGTLIHVYAASYMETEPAYWRFFCYLNLFIFAMLLLVLGDNFVVMFFGWEGVGLCSYLLIGFWYQDYNKASAGMKAFVVNRVGDWGFICGMSLLFWGLGGAWVVSQDSGTDYVSDYRARFITVEAQPLSQHAAGHGDEHGAADGADHGAGAEHESGHAAPHGAEHAAPAGAGHGDGFGFGPDTRLAQVPDTRLAQVPDTRLAQVPDTRLAQAPAHDDHGHDHAGHDQPGRDQAPHGNADGTIQLRPGAGSGPRDASGLQHAAGELGTLTMTTHAGARVYFGITRFDQLTNTTLESCRSKPSWSAADGPQIGPHCYVEAPFIRKRISAGLHAMVIVPGNGAVVAGDGDEVAAMHLRVSPGKNMLVAAVGPTLTFREIHDQLVIKDRNGRMFLKDALKEKSVWGIALVTLACLCFFVGATGKSAQIPLYVWLPDAMAGPTPVSALIHAATMVTAGVYMIARMNFLFGMTPTASGVVALVGALTALFAATIGFFQYDIKKVLAYSTVSQLGFMFIGVGVGAYWAGVFHLMTHAFFKACLFLGSGSVIHGMHHVVHDEAGSQDMRNMGGLRAVMPLTAKTYFVACLAITAAPIPFFAGFWSKDEILWKAFNSQHLGFVPGWLIFAIGLAAALGTSFYMWRSYYLTFEGKHAIKEIKDKVHESPHAMTYVLVVLAFLSTVTGVTLGISSHFTGGVGEGVLPHEPLLEQWLHPVLAHNDAQIGDAGYVAMYALMAMSVVGALGCWAFARLKYGADRDPNWAENERRVPGFALMQNKYYVDEIYQATIVAAFMRLRLVLAEMDRWIVDGIVNGVAVVARGAAWITGAIDRYIVDGAVNFVAGGTLKAGNKLRQMQTGRVQNYVYGILGGVAVLAVIQYFLG